MKPATTGRIPGALMQINPSAPHPARQRCARGAIACLMRRPVGRCLAVVVLAASGALHAGDQDVVNERPPVSPRQLEQHWGVDCEALRRELLASGTVSAGDAATAPTHEDARARVTRWHAGLRLCAAIHNAPGAGETPRCPDYARAARVIDENAAGGDDTMQAQIEEALQCES